jgi:hypothetical protein
MDEPRDGRRWREEASQVEESAELTWESIGFPADGAAQSVPELPWANPSMSPPLLRAAEDVPEMIETDMGGSPLCTPQKPFRDIVTPLGWGDGLFRGMSEASRAALCKPVEIVAAGDADEAGVRAAADACLRLGADLSLPELLEDAIWPELRIPLCKALQVHVLAVANGRGTVGTEALHQATWTLWARLVHGAASCDACASLAELALIGLEALTSFQVCSSKPRVFPSHLHPLPWDARASAPASASVPTASDKLPLKCPRASELTAAVARCWSVVQWGVQILARMAIGLPEEAPQLLAQALTTLLFAPHHGPRRPEWWRPSVVWTAVASRVSVAEDQDASCTLFETMMVWMTPTVVVGVSSTLKQSVLYDQLLHAKEELSGGGGGAGGTPWATSATRRSLSRPQRGLAPVPTAVSSSQKQRSQSQRRRPPALASDAMAATSLDGTGRVKPKGVPHALTVGRAWQAAFALGLEPATKASRSPDHRMLAAEVLNFALSLQAQRVVEALKQGHANPKRSSWTREVAASVQSFKDVCKAVVRGWTGFRALLRHADSLIQRLVIKAAMVGESIALFTLRVEGEWRSLREHMPEESFMVLAAALPITVHAVSIALATVRSVVGEVDGCDAAPVEKVCRLLASSIFCNPLLQRVLLSH